MGESEKIKIGDWTVTPALNVLERNGHSVPIKPLTMDVLVYLSSHAGEVVSADELITSVWKGQVVGDGSVYQTINQLRQALGDDREGARFVETIPKRGYRLVATVAPLAAERPIRSRAWRPAIVVLLILALGVVLARYLPEGGRGDVLPTSVAVLPFENLSPNPDDAYFAAGLHEEILNQLSKISALHVIARTSVAQYANGNKSIAQIAEELNVESVMEGSVRYAGDRIRVTIQLIDPATDAHVWSETYDRKFDDIFAIESDIAISVANILEAEFSLAEQRNIERLPTESAAAYARYLRSIAELVIPDVQYLDEAITLDPDFALAHATKAYAFAYQLPGISSNAYRRQEPERIIRESADRALALDPTLGLAHAALAFSHVSGWRWPEAEQAFEQALQWSPNDPGVLVLYVRFSRYRGDYAEGIRVAQRAVQLDPHNPVLHFHLGVTHRLVKNHDAATAAFQEAINLVPDYGNAHAQLASVEAAQGRRAEALRELQITEQLYEQTELGMADWRIAQLANVFAQLDRRQDVVRLFDTLVERDKASLISQATWALVYLALEDYEESLRRLEAAINNRTPALDDLISLGEFAANSYANPVLEQPRWRALRNQIGAL